MERIDEVQKLAGLARLAIPEEQVATRAAEFDSIVTYIGQLDELALDLVGTPTVSAVHNVFREDGESTPPGTWTEKLTDAFPEKSGGYLSVKKIIPQD
jgi:aspartyl-tRNA(Asn)/glutamyl-tRNA(Gln) amidotransferase subunit C